MTDIDHLAGRKDAATRMTEAALALLEGLTDQQRPAATWQFPDDERERWFYTPTDHGGLPLSEMTSAQHRLAHQLLATGLSRSGYVTAVTIMGLENVLDHTEGFTAGFTRERGRDPQLYWVAVFGTPGSDAWGWRFAGHHLSLHYTVIEGVLVSSTPSFFGADPAASPLLGPHLHRPLAGPEDFARELVHSLDEAQQGHAVVAEVAPPDIIGVNRTRLSEGDTTLPLELIWRGRFEDELDRAVAAMYRTAESNLGITAEHYAALSFTPQPKGLSAGSLNEGQQSMLRTLLGVYLDRIPDDLADAEHAKFAGDRLTELSFLWAGETEAGRPHYYRIQGQNLLVEYDNTARDANHVHAVWRDLSSDFGWDALAAHRSTAEHH